MANCMVWQMANRAGLYGLIYMVMTDSYSVILACHDEVDECTLHTLSEPQHQHYVTVTSINYSGLGTMHAIVVCSLST